MVALTFPDGARRDYPKGTTGLDIAKGISPSLAKRTVAMALDGTLTDLTDPIERDAAKRVFRDKGELFKVELVDAIPDDQQIKIYKQGDWFDLCRGPHMTSTGKVGSAFKLMKVAGAYWRGDSNREMLSRIYGTAFAKQEELEAYLKQIEEAEKRDHRKLGREMDLFHFQEEAPGSVFWHPKGWTLFQTLENYIRRRQTDAGYAEVNAPQLIDSSLWVATGHMTTFCEAIFLVQPREEDER